MEIELRLFATLQRPELHHKKLRLDDGATVRDLLDKIEIPSSHVSIILVNGLSSGTEQVLSHGDVVSLFPPVAGG